VDDLQDAELLEFLRAKIQRDYPGFLEGDFVGRFNALPLGDLDLVINDDVRYSNMITLSRLGFHFVRVTGPIRGKTGVTRLDKHNSIEQRISSVPTKFEVANTGSLSDLELNLRHFLAQFSHGEDVQPER
jgi:hypothetical protein